MDMQLCFISMAVPLLHNLPPERGRLEVVPQQCGEVQSPLSPLPHPSTHPAAFGSRQVMLVWNGLSHLAHTGDKIAISAPLILASTSQQPQTEITLSWVGESPGSQLSH